MKGSPRSRGATQIRAERSYIARMVILPVHAQIHAEEAGGIMLLLGTVVGLVWANSPWSHSYHAILHQAKLTLDLGLLTLSNDLHHWINDGLMTFFFLLVGLEIKREVSEGELSSVKRAAFPVLAALGGMIVPAGLYLAITAGGPEVHGWGIPVATDIAFAIGALALLGSRVPYGLKVFLLAFAVVDDIGGILIIAGAYAGQVSWTAMGAAGLLVALIIALRRSGLQSAGVYGMAGVLLWLTMSRSGVHPSMAGVILGLLTPARSTLSRKMFPAVAESIIEDYRRAVERADENRVDTLLGQLEELTRATEEPVERSLRRLRPWVSYVVLPLFAAANSGVELSGPLIRETLSTAASYGIWAGLLIGKPVGVFGAAWLAARLRLASPPAGVTWRHVAGAGLLAGIGFTISLFITELAFKDERLAAAARISILSASLLAALLGYTYLRMSTGRPGHP